MKPLLPRLALSLLGATWLFVFSRPGLAFSPTLRSVLYGLVLLVTFVLLRGPAAGGDESRGDGRASRNDAPGRFPVFGPLAVVANASFCILLLTGIWRSLAPGLKIVAVLVLVQVHLLLFLAVTERRAAEEARVASRDLLNEKTQQLLYLQQVGIAMNTAEEIKSFLDIVLRAAANITKAGRVLLFLDNGDGRPDLEAACNVDDFMSSVVELERNELVDRVLSSGASLIHPLPAVPDSVAELPSGIIEIDEGQASRLPLVPGSSFMALPLVRKNGCWGVFYAERDGDDRAGPFSLVEMEVFRVLASQISVALENADLYFRMRRSYRNTIEALAAAIEAKDAYTSGHSSAVTRYAVPVAREMGLGEEAVRSVEFAAILHDIGKIAIPVNVLNKPGKLSFDEFEDIKRHPSIGAEIIKSVEFLGDAMLFIKHHHERWDGAGYPDGLKGDEIPVGAQIVAVVDTFDAMTSTRSYRKALAEEEAVREIARCSGTQFNPDVVKAFMRAYEAGRIRTSPERACPEAGPAVRRRDGSSGETELAAYCGVVDGLAGATGRAARRVVRDGAAPLVDLDGICKESKTA